MRTTITQKTDGTIRAVLIADDEWAECPWTPGETGCLERLTDAYGDELSMTADRAGIAGNVSPTRRMHGWRGTTNGVSSTGLGWRRVESVIPRKRGNGWVVVFSADLRRDEP